MAKLTEATSQPEQDLRDTIRETASQVRDAARQKFDQVREQAGEQYEQSKQRAKDWEHDLESYVKQKPIKSLLIAAGVGVILGVLWKRS